MDELMKDQTTPLIPLSNATLSELPPEIETPTYDRAALRPGIVHIGLGNFHRAHQAWYLHRLMQKGLAQDWAIIGAGVRAYDEKQRKKLAAQDYLTTLIMLDPEHASTEVTGSMIDYVPIEDRNAPLIACMADPAIRIVSLTVTEGGYYVDPATQSFDATHPDILHDAAHPDTPRTAFGAIIAALALRRAAGAGPFTLQSCDNLQGNGAILRQTVMSLAELSDPALARWIDQTCSFPNSMVDCIVPATGPNEIALAHSLGVQDEVPVTHEPFRQWVIEDDFCAGRPDWDQVGATFTANVHDYEMMKIRILNGGHQLLANAGELLSVETISDCMAHPQIGAFFRKTAETEIIAHVKPVTGMTSAAYVDLVASRFANPRIVDTTRRVAFDGASRHTGFLLPTLREALDAGAPSSGLALAEALWARMCAGSREDGTLIEANDPHWSALHDTAQAAKDAPLRWLEQQQYYGDLAGNPVFVDQFSGWLLQIWAEGTEAALATYLGS
ncbi:MAG: mannitol dehydrogenase family protein [Pseudomonadota bacterium]